MQMRKLFAGVAALATLLGGLALGASTANAVETTDAHSTGQPIALNENATTNITIKGSAASLSGHTFKFVRIGTYTYAKSANAIVDGHLLAQGVSVETDSDALGYLNTVLKSVDTGYEQDSKYYDTNPAGYIAEHMNDSRATATPKWSGVLRNFVTALVNNPNFAATTADYTLNAGRQTEDEVTLTRGVQQGFYVVVDVTNNSTDNSKGNEGTYRASIPMVVGTKVVGTVNYQDESGAAKSLTGEFDFANDGYGKTGVVEVKNDRPTINKTITGIDDGTTSADENATDNVTEDHLAASAGIGDKVKYQIGDVEIPSTVGYDTIKFPYYFSITDTLHKGQTFNNDITVYVDKNGNQQLDNGEALHGVTEAADPANYDYKLTVNAPDENGNTVFTVDLAKYIGGYTLDNNSLVDGSAAGLDNDLIGKKIYVTYSATLNNDAIVYPDGSNDNGVKLEYSNNPGNANHGTVTPPDTQVFTGKFSLKKVNKQGATLAGAKFKVQKNGTTLKFVCAPKGTCKVVSDPDTPNVAEEVEVGDDGLLHLAGLEGTYTVTETKAPEGYSSLFLPSFDVTVKTTPKKSNALLNNKYYVYSEADPQNPTDPSKFVVKANANTTVTVAKQDAWKLVDNKLVEGNVKVTNITSVTQLPLTGAAGIAMFGVIAALLVGASVTVYMKSRATKRALRA